ncbi:DUF397 domain-containing protein [Nocardia pseudobrasiliensis]|uniref:DUF397 domain-containing protein n=1 Tax=Nocardia pseudobrasiliensis TaxID=45979 RepID=UPI00082D8482|nr:DUF397 domain-containing protein [Nocardia pseudobrasiliensis]
MSVDLSEADWFKSSHSGASQECVEIAFLPGGTVGVRDSKDPTGPALTFTAEDWDTFIVNI